MTVLASRVRTTYGDLVANLVRGDAFLVAFFEALFMVRPATFPPPSANPSHGNSTICASIVSDCGEGAGVVFRRKPNRSSTPNQQAAASAIVKGKRRHESSTRGNLAVPCCVN